MADPRALPDQRERGCDRCGHVVALTFLPEYDAHFCERCAADPQALPSSTQPRRWTIFVCPLHPELAQMSWACRFSSCSVACEPVVVMEWAPSQSDRRCNVHTIWNDDPVCAECGYVWKGDLRA